MTEERLTIDDIIDAITNAISLYEKERTHNPVIKNNPKLKEEYKRKSDIMSKLKQQWVIAKMQSKKPTLKPVRKRPF